MWTSIPNDSDKKYYIKYDKNSLGYVFYVTDFTHIWEKDFTNGQLFSSILEANPLLEGDETGVISQCLNVLFDCLTKSNIEVSITFEDDKQDLLLIKFKTLRSKIPFRFNLQCKVSTPLRFYEKITQELLQIIKELKESENYLCECLEKKDAEIADYKAKGSTLSLKHLETPPFNQHEHKLLFTPSSHSLFNIDNVLSHEAINTESTPKHSIKRESPVSRVKSETKADVISSSISSPVKQSGIAPLLMQANDDMEDEPQESLSLLGKRKKIIKKQLNL